MNRKIKKTTFFILITYIITIFYFYILKLIGSNLKVNTINFIGFSMCIPLISVIIVQKIIFHEKLKGTLGLSLKFNRWVIIGILIPIIITASLMIFSFLVLNITFFTIRTFMISILVGLSIASLSALIEELAWRGFLFNELSFLGLAKSSLLISLFWALWHLPVTILYKYPGNPISGSLINIGQMFVISLIITYIRYKTHSVYIPAIMHGLFNTMILSNIMDDFKVVYIKIIICSLIICIFVVFEKCQKKHKKIKFPSNNSSDPL